MANPVVIEALGKHTATIIFSHGLGDSAQGWIPLARSLSAKKPFQHIRWVLPTAPMQPVTINMGMRMTSWFDIQDLGDGNLKAEDDKGMLASVRTINSLISKEVDEGIPSERVIVGGFSQGAVIAYLTALTSERKLAGVVCLSGFLGMADKIKSMMTDYATKLPVFHGHGTADQVVQYKWGKESVEKLKELGFKDIEFKSYPGMPHSFCDAEQKDLEAFLTKVLPTNSVCEVPVNATRRLRRGEGANSAAKWLPPPRLIHQPFLLVRAVPTLAVSLAAVLLRARLPWSALPSIAVASPSSVTAASLIRSMGSATQTLPPMQPAVVLEAVGKPHDATVIWSHGLGDSAMGWADFAEEMRRELPGTKWVLTNAPRRAVTINGGNIMPAWMDVKRFGAGPEDEDLPGMLASIESLNTLIAKEVAAGIPSEKVVVGGFSQGAVISLLTGLTSQRKLAGICVLSGFLGMTHEEKINSLIGPHTTSTPILWAHGTADPVIRFMKAQTGVDYLETKLGLKDVLEFKKYEGMQHSLGWQEKEDITEWLKKVLG
ncbi:hypothetical protein JCM1841_002232 [Sporobolomyces salmonicolor]